MQTLTNDIVDKLLHWGNSIKAIAQTGLSFSDDFHNKGRYNELLKIASEILVSINDDFSIEKGKAERVYALLNKELYSGIMGYVTPKSSVAAAVFSQNNQILLVRSKGEEHWALPGGWADEKWTPAENAQREVLEETHLRVCPSTFLGVFDSRYHPFNTTTTSYTLLFVCELCGGDLVPLESEVSSAGFFSENDLPPLLIGSREQIIVAYKWKHGTLREPFFDH